MNYFLRNYRMFHFSRVLYKKKTQGHHIPGRFLFLAHPRDLKEIKRQIPILKLFGPRVGKRVLRKMNPVRISKIDTPLVAPNGTKIEGDFIVIPEYAAMLFENLRGIRQKVKDAVRMGTQLGDFNVGLGSFLPAILSGGDFLESEYNVRVCTGSNFNTYIMISNLYTAASKLNINLCNETICIIGATLPTGINVASELALVAKKVILSDVPSKALKLDAVKKQIEERLKEEKATSCQIEIETDSSKLSQASTFMVFTSATGTLPSVEQLSPGTLILDDTQPRAISKEYETARRDLIVCEGGLISLPGVNTHFNFGLLRKDVMWGCLAETIALAWLGANGDDKSSIDFSLKGHAAAKKIASLVDAMGFTQIPLMSRKKEVLTKEAVAAFLEARAQKISK